MTIYPRVSGLTPRATREREEQREKRKGCRLRDVVRRRIPVLVRLDPRDARLSLSLSLHLSLCPAKYNYIELTISLAHMTDSLSVNSIYVYVHTSFCPSTTTIRFFKSLNFSSCSYFSFLLSFSISLSRSWLCTSATLSFSQMPSSYIPTSDGLFSDACHFLQSEREGTARCAFAYLFRVRWLFKAMICATLRFLFFALPFMAANIYSPWNEMKPFICQKNILYTEKNEKKECSDELEL